MDDITRMAELHAEDETLRESALFPNKDKSTVTDPQKRGRHYVYKVTGVDS